MRSFLIPGSPLNHQGGCACIGGRICRGAHASCPPVLCICTPPVPPHVQQEWARKQSSTHACSMDCKDLAGGVPVVQHVGVHGRPDSARTGALLTADVKAPVGRGGSAPFVFVPSFTRPGLFFLRGASRGPAAASFFTLECWRWRQYSDALWLGIRTL